MRPLFIVVDGVEGCGKSTQVSLLARHLATQGYDVLVTHEPGGTAVGEGIRQLLLERRYAEMTALTETLLFCASRAQHCQQVIGPALAAGRIVVCDRFASSTAAYQGYAGGVGLETVHRVNEVATGGLQPDLVIILDLDPAAGLRRKYGNCLPLGDRIEQKPAEFHAKVREGFLQYARAHADRTTVIDANAPPAQVHSTIIAALQPLLQPPAGQAGGR